MTSATFPWTSIFIAVLYHAGLVDSSGSWCYLRASVKLFVAIGILEGADRCQLDDPERMKACLEAAVRAGGFSLCDLRIVKFSPSGITAAAIVGESHLAIHTWPEEGRLFFDVASCRDAEGVERAVEALVAGIDGATIAEIVRRSVGR